MARSMNKSFGPVQFEGEDFENWQSNMETTFDQHGVKHCILEERKIHDAPFKRCDTLCKALIEQYVADPLSHIIKDKATAFQMWSALRSAFGKKGPISGQVNLRKKLLTMKLQNNQSIESHLGKFEERIKELKSLGAKLQEIDVVVHLLLTLPPEYDGLATFLDGLDPQSITLDLVRSKLLYSKVPVKKIKEEEVDLEDSLSAILNSRTPDLKAGRTNNRRSAKCQNCGRFGHYTNQCRSGGQANNKKTQPQDQNSSSTTQEKKNCFPSNISQVHRNSTPRSGSVKSFVKREMPSLFIGDLYYSDRGTFEGSCLNGSLSVLDLAVQEENFQLTMDLSAHFDNAVLNKSGMHAVCGIAVEISVNDETIIPGEIYANVGKVKQEDLILLPVDVKVQENVKITQCQLLSISSIRNFLEKNSKDQNSYCDLENVWVLELYNQYFEEAEKISQNDKKLPVLSTSDKTKLENLQQTLSDNKANFLISSSDFIQNWNSSNWANKIFNLLSTIDIHHAQAVAANIELKAIAERHEGKGRFIESLRCKGIEYVNNSNVLNSKAFSGESFILFFCEEFVVKNKTHFRETLNFFVEMVKQNARNQKFLAVDLDVIPKIELTFQAPKKMTIYHLSGSNVVSYDYQNDFETANPFQRKRMLNVTN